MVNRKGELAKKKGSKKVLRGGGMRDVKAAKMVHGDMESGIRSLPQREEKRPRGRGGEGGQTMRAKGFPSFPPPQPSPPQNPTCVLVVSWRGERGRPFAAE